MPCWKTGLIETRRAARCAVKSLGNRQLLDEGRQSKFGPRELASLRRTLPSASVRTLGPSVPERKRRHCGETDEILAETETTGRKEVYKHTDANLERKTTPKRRQTEAEARKRCRPRSQLPT